MISTTARLSMESQQGYVLLPEVVELDVRVQKAGQLSPISKLPEAVVLNCLLGYLSKKDLGSFSMVATDYRELVTKFEWLEFQKFSHGIYPLPGTSEMKYSYRISLLKKVLKADLKCAENIYDKYPAVIMGVSTKVFEKFPPNTGTWVKRFQKIVDMVKEREFFSASPYHCYRMLCWNRLTGQGISCRQIFYNSFFSGLFGIGIASMISCCVTHSCSCAVIPLVAGCSCGYSAPSIYSILVCKRSNRHRESFERFKKIAESDIPARPIEIKD